jgi:hypothetical protein
MAKIYEAGDSQIHAGNTWKTTLAGVVPAMMGAFFMLPAF